MKVSLVRVGAGGMVSRGLLELCLELMLRGIVQDEEKVRRIGIGKTDFSK